MCWVIPAYIGLVDREGVAHRLTLQAFDEGLEAGTGQFVRGFAAAPTKANEYQGLTAEMALSLVTGHVAGLQRSAGGAPAILADQAPPSATRAPPEP